MSNRPRLLIDAMFLFKLIHRPKNKFLILKDEPLSPHMLACTPTVVYEYWRNTRAINVPPMPKPSNRETPLPQMEAELDAYLEKYLVDLGITPVKTPHHVVELMRAHLFATAVRNPGLSDLSTLKDQARDFKMLCEAQALGCRLVAAKPGFLSRHEQLLEKCKFASPVPVRVVECDPETGEEFKNDEDKLGHMELEDEADSRLVSSKQAPPLGGWGGAAKYGRSKQGEKEGGPHKTWRDRIAKRKRLFDPSGGER